MYLRLHDYLVVLGVFQIYLEYYQSTLPEKRAVEHISHMIEVERQRYRKDIMEEERSIVVGGDGGDDDDDDVPRLNI